MKSVSIGTGSYGFVMSSEISVAGVDVAGPSVGGDITMQIEGVNFDRRAIILFTHVPYCTYWSHIVRLCPT